MTTQPMLIEAMRSHAHNPRVMVRVEFSDTRSLAMTAADFLTELDAFITTEILAAEHNPALRSQP